MVRCTWYSLFQKASPCFQSLRPKRSLISLLPLSDREQLLWLLPLNHSPVRTLSSPFHLPGFPSGSDTKVSASNVRDLGLISGLGRCPGKGNGNPLQYSCLENPMDRAAWCRLQSMGSQRVEHTWVTSLSLPLPIPLHQALLCSGHYSNGPQVPCGYWSHTSTPNTSLAIRNLYPPLVIWGVGAGVLNMWLEVAERQRKHVWAHSTLMRLLHWFPYFCEMRKKELRSYLSKLFQFLHKSMCGWKVKS